MRVCALGGGSLPREHNKLFVFIMHLAFEKRMKVSLFYFIFRTNAPFTDFICICYVSFSLFKYLQPALLLLSLLITAKYSYYHKLDAYKVVDYYSKLFWVIKWLCYPSWLLVG